MRVYRYNCEPASAADDASLHRQLWLAGSYRRTLAEIESIERSVIAALYRECPIIRQGEMDLVEALREKQETRAAELALVLRVARRERSQLQEHKDKLAAIRERRGPLVRAARASFSKEGLYWGTYLIVEDAHDRACRDSKYWEPMTVSGAWNSIAVQIQASKKKEFKGSDLTGTDPRIRISPTPYPLGPRVGIFASVGVPQQEKDRSDRVRPSRWRSLKIRTGSTGGGNRTPVWTTLHMMSEGRMRPVPPEARVLWVKVVRTETTWQAVRTPEGPKMVPRERWEVQITADDIQQRSAPTGEGTVGIDIGWRRVEGGIRVAMARTVRGFSELVIPDAVLQRRSAADGIRSVRDRHIEDLRAAVLTERRKDEAPAWLVEATETTHAWRKIGRFVNLIKLMISHGYRADAASAEGTFVEGLTTILVDRDRHLRDYEAGLRRRQRLIVSGRVDSWISSVLDGHHVLGIESTIRIDKMRKKTPFQDEGARQAAVAHVEVAAGRLRLRAIQMAASRGINVVEVPPLNTSRICSECGAEREGSAELMVTCPQCGTVEDQDVSAAREISRRASAEVQAGEGILRDHGDSGAPEKKRPARRNRKAPKKVPIDITSLPL